MYLHNMTDTQQQCVNLLKALFATIAFPDFYSANTCVDVIYLAAYHATHRSSPEEVRYKLEGVVNGRPDGWLDLVVGVVAMLPDTLLDLGFETADETTLVNTALHLKYDGFAFGQPLVDFDLWRRSKIKD